MAYDPYNTLSGLERWASIEAGLIASTDATSKGKRIPADIKPGYKHILNAEQIGRKRLLLIDPATGELITTGKKLGQTFKPQDIIRILLTQPELMGEISDLSNMMRGEPGKPSGFVINTGREFHFEGAKHVSKTHNIGRPIVLPKGQQHLIKRMLSGIGKTVEGQFVFHPEILAEIEMVDKAMRTGGITGALPTAGTGRQWTKEILASYTGDLKASTSEGLINQLLKFKDNLTRIVTPSTTVLPDNFAGTKKFLQQKPIEMGKLAELLKKQSTGTMALIDKVAKTQPELATTIRELFLKKPIYDESLKLEQWHQQKRLLQAPREGIGSIPAAKEGLRTNITRSELLKAVGEIEGEIASKGKATTKGLLLRHIVDVMPEKEPKPKWVRPKRKEILAGIHSESKLLVKGPGVDWHGLVKAKYKKGVKTPAYWKKLTGHKRQRTVESFKKEPHFLVDAQNKMDVKPTKAEASLARARLESGGHAAGWGPTKYPLTQLGPELGDTGARLQGAGTALPKHFYQRMDDTLKLEQWHKQRQLLQASREGIGPIPAPAVGTPAPAIAELERISQAGGNLGAQRTPAQPTRPFDVVPGPVDDVKLAEKAKAVAGKAKFNIPSSPWFSSIRKAPKSLMPLMILAGLVGTMGSNQGMKNAA